MNRFSKNIWKCEIVFLLLQAKMKLKMICLWRMINDLLMVKEKN